jgi:probable FeS assembly SUF system protein SufT
MDPGETVNLTRECEAVLIPSGEKCLLPAGVPLSIHQSLGGSYTAVVDGALVRIDGKDADALGLAPVPAPATPATTSSSGPLDEDLVWKQLRTCYDPEIPVNIVELGLVYDLHIAPQPDASNLVEVKMTLTAPGCGMGAMIAEDVQRKILSLPGVSEAKVELVFDPPWNQGMMSEAARLELGLM